jgi:phosphoribulokinase
MELHLERLHYGQAILKPVYDHAAGTLVRPDYVLAREFVIVEGLLGFLTPTMRQFYDVKVYLDPPEDLRWAWKVKRDTSKRGYTPAQVQAERQRREPDSQAFIRPQREHADIVVRFAPADGITTEKVEPRLDARLVLRPTIVHPDLSYLLEKEGDATPGIRLELGRDQGRPADFLEIDGGVTAEHAAELEDAVWQHLGAEKFGAYQDRTTVRHSQTLALTQLLITYHLLRKYGDVSELHFAPAIAALSRLNAAQSPVAQGR